MCQAKNYKLKITFNCFFVCMTALTSCNNPTTSTSESPKDTTWRILEYGMIIKYDKESAMNVVAKKYGFEYYRVAGGCLVTKELVDSVNQNNNLIESKIAGKYGSDWRDRYNKDVDREDSIEQIALGIINEMPLVQKCMAERRGQEKLSYSLTPISESKYQIRGTFTKDTTTIEAYQCFLISVDYKSKEITILNDEMRKIYPPSVSRSLVR